VHALGDDDRGQAHAAPAMGELESILQEVRERGRQQRAVPVDRHGLVHRGHHEPDLTRLRLERRADLQLGEELGDHDMLEALDTGIEPHLGE